MNRFVEASIDYRHPVLVPIPGLPKLSKHRFRTNLDDDSYGTFDIEGTMASGDPYTTIMNTWRSICYVSYYLRNETFKTSLLVAGDDVVVLCNEQDMKNIAQIIISKTARDING